MGSFYYVCDKSGSVDVSKAYLSVANGSTCVVLFAGLVFVGKEMVIVVAVRSKKVWDN